MNELRTIHVAFLASEADPLVKVGGLGDVAGSLPRELNRLPENELSGYNLEVRLFIPFHYQIRNKINPEMIDTFEIKSTTGAIPIEVYQHRFNSTLVYLFAFPLLGEQTPVYSSDNQKDGEIYTCFSAAVMKFLTRLRWKADIIHANDWHTAPAVSLLRKKRKTARFFSDMRSILTVHNLPYMGGGAEASLRHFRIGYGHDPLLPGWARRQPLPIGLECADRIVAVSPTYAQEILKPEFGCGLEAFLASRLSNLMGILNGLDNQLWDPSIDQAIQSQFSLETLLNRKKNKEFLISKFNLDPSPTVPLLVYISRMDYQKGIDILLDGLSQTTNLPWNAVILGTGDPKLEAKCREFQTANPERVHVVLGFDAQLARQLYAGGDMLLMPSRYEPCGLAQMIAMRYGCIPIARATGGLKDTIIDYKQNNATGFLFEDAIGSALSTVLKAAVRTYHDKKKWLMIQKQGMRTDFSWKKSALQYARTYLAVLEK